jgi:hypothetical protein
MGSNGKLTIGRHCGFRWCCDRRREPSIAWSSPPSGSSSSSFRSGWPVADDTLCVSAYYCCPMAAVRVPAI